MSQISNLSRLTIALATLSATSMTYAAGLDRSGQDITAFLQDGTYAEVTYTYIDTNVSGHDNAIPTGSKQYIKGQAFDSITEPYGFVRYGVKADVNDTFSVGVIYDEPFGAKAGYTGDNNFTGNALLSANSTRLLAKQQGLAKTSQAALNKLEADKKKDLEAASDAEKPVIEKIYNGLMDPNNGSLEASKKLFSSLPDDSITDKQLDNVIGIIDTVVAGKQADFNQKVQSGVLTGKPKEVAEKLLQDNIRAVNSLKAAQAVANAQATNTEKTKVDVKAQNFSVIGGVKLGSDKRLQVYGGPVLQRAEARINLRGDAYGPVSGYDAYVAPNDALGWLAGVSYSIPEIALKAAVTYRSGIEHKAEIAEHLPIAGALRSSPDANFETIVTTPQSVNVNFQTGLSAKHQLLGTVNARWVPWSKFVITPPLYNGVSKTRFPPDGLNLVDYSDDQWQVDVGLGKRINPKLAVSGVVGWDSGAGNPVTSLGPIDGYWSVGGGAKYNLTDTWAISAGGKYMMFGDAKGALPDGSLVNDAQKNTGFAAGVKLSYEGK